MKIRRLSALLSAGVIFGCAALCAAGIFAGCGKGDAQKSIAESDRSGYETMEFETIVKPEGMDAFVILADGTLLGGGSGEKVYIYQQDGTGQRELALDGSYLTFFCADGGALYAYDNNRKAVVELTVGADTGTEGALSADVRVIEDDLAFCMVRNMVALDGKIYVLAIPLTKDTEQAVFSFGAGEFEDYGEQVYCIDAQSGEHSILDLEHITAEYRSEDGRLFFYGWKEERYCLYEYDAKKGEIVNRLSLDNMGNLWNMVVEGGYLFAVSSTKGLYSLDLKKDDLEVWQPSIFTINGNDLQFYHGNLFVHNMTFGEIQQVLSVGSEGEILANSAVLDRMPTDGSLVENDTIDDAATPTPKPTAWPKRTERVGVSDTGYLVLNPDEIKRISGLRTKTVERSLELEAFITELMAGNPDVDIYIIGSGSVLVPRIKELGMYTPLNDSEIISGYLGNCFDYIKSAATNENGDIWMAPLYEYCQMTWYVPENMEKFGVTPQELCMLDSYIAVLERLHDEMGEFHYYNHANRFFLQCDSMYDKNYNDYEAGKIDFDTDLYRSIAGFFWPGWDRYGSATANHPLFFNLYQRMEGEVMTLGKTPDLDKNTVIFKTVDWAEHLWAMSLKKTTEMMEGWRVVPFPKLASENEQNLVSVTCAFVNPYSQQKDAATEYLEVVLENQVRTVRQPAFFREDVEYYKAYYDTSLPAFQDMYEIFKNASVPQAYSWDTSNEYITEFQRGLISFDEAIARRQRSAVMGLEE